MSADTAQPLGIGPVLQDVSSFGYRGIRAGISDNFTAPASIFFELRGGTSQVEVNPPGKVVFENFEITSNTAPSPTVTAISRTNFTVVSFMKSGFHYFAISLPDCLRKYRGL